MGGARMLYARVGALVLVGLVIAIERPLQLQITPELILAIFVPPLVFEAAFELDFRLLRDNLVPIVVLAVPGVVLTALLVGGVVSLGAGLPLGVAVVFGALISATDPVAVVSLFRALGVPRRLSTTVEGESLFNDGTAIVIFQIAVAAALSGAFHPLNSILSFFRVSTGGVTVGLVLGLLAAQLIARVDDRLVVTTATTLLAYGAYLLAERLGFSGVLAVATAGLVSGSVGLVRASPSTKIMLFNLWDFFAFLSNSIVFLLIGLNVNLLRLWAGLWPVIVAVIAVLLSRAVIVYGLSWLAQRFIRRVHIPLSWQHVLFWGGLRGAIGLALALSLPVALAERELLQSMTFGVVLFTLVAQGTTVQFLLKKLGLTRRQEHRIEHERRLGELFAAQEGLRRLERMHREGLLTDEMWAGLHDEYLQARRQLASNLNQLFMEHAELEREMILQARREALQAERGALGDALRRGLISADVHEMLQADVDRRLEALDLIQIAIHEGRVTRGD